MVTLAPRTGYIHSRHVQPTFSVARLWDYLLLFIKRSLVSNSINNSDNDSPLHVLLLDYNRVFMDNKRVLLGTGERKKGEYYIHGDWIVERNETNVLIIMI